VGVSGWLNLDIVWRTTDANQYALPHRRKSTTPQQNTMCLVGTDYEEQRHDGGMWTTVKKQSRGRSFAMKPITTPGDCTSPHSSMDIHSCICRILPWFACSQPEGWSAYGMTHLKIRSANTDNLSAFVFHCFLRTLSAARLVDRQAVDL
jgi:hypothetical protein